MLNRVMLLSTLIFLGGAQAQAIKCVVNGKTIYQATPCDRDAVGSAVNLTGAGTSDQSSQATSYIKREAARLDRAERVDAAVRNGRVFVGMTADEVLNSWGKPNRINQSMGASRTSEQWIYERGSIGRSQYIYVDNGVVTFIQSPKLE